MIQQWCLDLGGTVFGDWRPGPSEIRQPRRGCTTDLSTNLRQWQPLGLQALDRHQLEEVALAIQRMQAAPRGRGFHKSEVRLVADGTGGGGAPAARSGSIVASASPTHRTSSSRVIFTGTTN